MKILTHASKRSSYLLVATITVFMGLFACMWQRVSAQAEPVEAGSRLVTIHDRGVALVVSTKAVTIGEALNEAGVTISDSDAVEPVLSEKLIANEYNVNIYRARSVMVIDGATKQKVVTPYQTGSQIAKSVGISLYPEDTTTLTRSQDIIADGAGLRMTIDRAVPFSLTLYGSTATSRTQGATIADMLKEKNIELGVNDRVLPSVETALTEGIVVRVWREGKQTITVEEPVAFSTENIQDGDQTVGYRSIKTAGISGLRNATYEVTIRDGVEVSRTEIASLVTKEPSPQIEIVGAKAAFLPYNGGGSKTEWLVAAGIPSADWGYADSIVMRESGWNPNAVNRSSGACGLAQALPCSKVPGDPLNPIDSLRWQHGYVNARYGGYAGAYAFWQANKWY